MFSATSSVLHTSQKNMNHFCQIRQRDKTVTRADAKKLKTSNICIKNRVTWHLLCDNVHQRKHRVH
jgi:hypothetical protein